MSVRLHVLFCAVVRPHVLFPGLLGCFRASRCPADCSMVLACAVRVFLAAVTRFSFFLVATLLWILDCFVCVRLRVLGCGVVWLHALFPGLFGCFPAPRFPADCSMVQACAVLFLLP